MRLGCGSARTWGSCRPGLCREGPGHPALGGAGDAFTSRLTPLWGDSLALGRGGGAGIAGGRTGGAPPALTAGRGALTAQVPLTNCLCFLVMRNCELTRAGGFGGDWVFKAGG